MKKSFELSENNKVAITTNFPKLHMCIEEKYKNVTISKPLVENSNENSETYSQSSFQIPHDKFYIPTKGSKPYNFKNQDNTILLQPLNLPKQQKKFSAFRKILNKNIGTINSSPTHRRKNLNAHLNFDTIDDLVVNNLQKTKALKSYEYDSNCETAYFAGGNYFRERANCDKSGRKIVQIRKVEDVISKSVDFYEKYKTRKEGGVKLLQSLKGCKHQDFKRISNVTIDSPVKPNHLVLDLHNSMLIRKKSIIKGKNPDNDSKSNINNDTNDNDMNEFFGFFHENLEHNITVKIWDNPFIKKRLEPFLKKLNEFMQNKHSKMPIKKLLELLTSRKIGMKTANTFCELTVDDL